MNNSSSKNSDDQARESRQRPIGLFDVGVRVRGGGAPREDNAPEAIWFVLGCKKDLVRKYGP